MNGFVRARACLVIEVCVRFISLCGLILGSRIRAGTEKGVRGHSPIQCGQKAYIAVGRISKIRVARHFSQHPLAVWRREKWF
jgi:hypothetical protein